MTTTEYTHLWSLAEAAVFVAVAGDQEEISIRILGGTHDSLRRVRVSQGSRTWEGPVADWESAVKEVASRPNFPPPGWAPGPYETWAREHC
jgi:hypothetical protein